MIVSFNQCNNPITGVVKPVDFDAPVDVIDLLNAISGAVKAIFYGLVEQEKSERTSRSIQGVRVLGESVSIELNSPFDSYVIENPGTPFGQSRNDYSCFKPLIDHFGVYIFQDKSSREVFYVGEAHEQDLKTRITQNYTENNTGGTFRKNWCEDESKDFKQFKSFLANCLIRTISINIDSRSLILAVEAILVTALNPKYNRG